jgi:hypothetical protein
MNVSDPDPTLKLGQERRTRSCKKTSRLFSEFASKPAWFLMRKKCITENTDTKIALVLSPLYSKHQISVADPDLHVFGHPGSGSGSTSQRYGSRSFYHHAKKLRKTLIPNIL